MARIAVIEAPLDSSGAGRAEERAPMALRSAGLYERLEVARWSEADARIRDAVRDPRTGVIGAADVRRASEAIRVAVSAARTSADLPLVIGGDCTLLLGVFAGLPAGSGLWFIDGHADFLDGQSSPTGECADMELAILTGHGTPGLLGELTPRVEPEAVVILGHRPADLHPDVALENARIDPAIAALTAPDISDRGAARVAAEAADRLASHPAWLHLDLDVLDAGALPAVSYPQPQGLGWDELVALARPLARARNLLGISVADFNPDRDPDGTFAGRIVAALARVLDR